MRKWVFISIISILFLTIMASKASACSCAPPPSPEEALERGDAIFSGEVVHIDRPDETNPGSGYMNVLIDVHRTWQGVNESQVIVQTHMHSPTCGYPFELNETYLIYAHDDLNVSLCSRTTPLNDADDDLSILGEGTAPTQEVNIPQLNWYPYAVAILLLVLIGVFLRR